MKTTSVPKCQKVHHHRYDVKKVHSPKSTKVLTSKRMSQRKKVHHSIKKYDIQNKS